MVAENFNEHPLFAFYDDQTNYTWKSRFEPFVNSAVPELFSHCPMFVVLDFFKEAIQKGKHKASFTRIHTQPSFQQDDMEASMMEVINSVGSGAIQAEINA